MKVKRLREWLETLPDDIEIVVRDTGMVSDIDDLVTQRRGGHDDRIVKAIITTNDDIKIRRY